MLRGRKWKGEKRKAEDRKLRIKSVEERVESVNDFQYSINLVANKAADTDTNE